MNDVEHAIRVLSDRRSILVFTGAGISTESGIPDFRGEDGLWTKVDPEDFNIARYRSRPDLRVASWRMHIDGERFGAQSGARPNRGHLAVVDLWEGGRVSGVVTQNVDGLHQAAGLPDEALAELHGNVRAARCITCGLAWDTETVLARVEAGDADPHCEMCGGVIKTDVVMFGEMLDESTVARAGAFLDRSDAVLVLGSTVAVSPASDIVIHAALRSLPIVIINKGPTDADHLATARIDGSIGDHLPGLVEALVGNSDPGAKPDS